MKFINWIQDQYMNPDQLPKLGQWLTSSATFCIASIWIWTVTMGKRLRWSRGTVLAFRTQVWGFKPGRSCRIFKGEKVLSTPSFGGEVKLSVPCRRFAAYKRSLNVAWKSTFRQN
jgi:hypothetical protein